MSQNAYKTISNPSEGLFKDRGSKFLAYAYPISSVDELKPLLTGLKDLHPSARHFCYAYQLGLNGDEYRANDDGEPNGSAGLPILNQIKSKEITNTLVVVVRYFGGTKLGVSGLVNAYKMAAKHALDNAKVVEEIPTSVISIRFPHSITGEVERIIRQNNYFVQNQDFGVDCDWRLKIPDEDLIQARKQLEILPDLILTQ